MPGIKATIYDGVIHVDSAILDLTGIIDVKANGATALGDSTITSDSSSGDPTDYLTSGDRIYNSSLQFLGKVSSVTSTVITLEKGIKVALANNDDIYLYPKFEIVAIQTLTSDTELNTLIPTNDKWAGNKLASGATWAETAEDNFGAVSDSEGSVIADVFPPGVTIEGRWKYLRVGSNESVMCYLKALPVRAFDN
jgi:hypothetical protein